MKISALISKRLKEKPSDCVLKSHELLVRGGYIKSLTSGIFALCPLGVRVIKNIEKIVREEMENVGAIEVEMPLVHPRELWEESGRYNKINNELLKFKDRTNRDFVLAMTHEESAVALVRDSATTYKDYPFSIYQIAKKYRDEARPRGGLIRVKEFTMKDAYSFHRTKECLDKTYDKFITAYNNIFRRVGIPEVVCIKSDSGMMGGAESHEFMLLCDAGEDTIITCDKCGYKANKEVAEFKILPFNKDEKLQNLEEVETKNVKTIEELSNFFILNRARFLKTVVYKNNDSLVMVLLRGDREVNENKLSKIFKTKPKLALKEDLIKFGLVEGFISPYKQENIEILADFSLQNEVNLIAGANKENYHIKNLNLKRDCNINNFFDLCNAEKGDVCKYCNHPINLERGIEVGNVFKLGIKYTEPMNMYYTDENNIKRTPIMGCYGIGIGRLMASIVEKKHDNNGILWSYSIAPFKISILSQNGTDEVTTEVYNKIQKLNIDVLLDDRDESFGVKFADNDLIGSPLTLIISNRNIKNNLIEWQNRIAKTSGFVVIDKLCEFITDFIKQNEQNS